MTQSSWSAIVARVKAQMDTIANIGKVSDYKRIVLGEIQQAAIGELTIDGENKFRHWSISLLKLDDRPEDAAGDMQWNRVVVIDGWLQMEDANASEKTTLALAESVIRTLWNDCRTTRLNDTILFGKPASIVSLTNEFFSMVACHHVTLHMPIQTLDSPT